jgi:flagellar hook assembly protein FlgD
VGIGTYGDWATVKYWSAVGIVEGQTSSTKRLLLEIHPNPAKTHSFIHYALPDDGRVSLSIYDVSGRLVKNLVDQHQKSGVYAVVWNGIDDNDREVAAGVYFCILSIEDGQLGKKFVVLE